MTGRSRVAAAAALAVVALSSCACDGSTSRGRRRIAGGRLLVYTSLPLIGPSAADGRAVLDGERMALAGVHGRVGRYRIVLRALDDATRSSRGPNPGATNSNATRAAAAERTIGFVGDLSSGASAVSLPVLNRAHIPQISPLSTAVGLTRSGPGAQPGEPAKYYPAGTRTFARVVPDDLVQSTALVTVAREAGCRRVYVLYDDEFDGRAAADSFLAVARRARLPVIGSDQFEPSPRSYRSLGGRLRALGPDCVVISALVQDRAVAVTEEVAAALPEASLYITSAVAEPAFVARHGGVAESDDPQLTISQPTLSPADYPPAGRRFLARFRRRYGAGAQEGIWGDAAMSLLLDAIRRAGGGDRGEVTRTRVLRAIFATRGQASVLGRYSITPSGDTTLRRWGVYHVVDRRLVFWRAVRG